MIIFGTHSTHSLLIGSIYESTASKESTDVACTLHHMLIRDALCLWKTLLFHDLRLNGCLFSGSHQPFLGYNEEFYSNSED